MALNTHLTTNSGELLAAFAPYIAPAITKADWRDATVMASKRAARSEITARIEAELIAQGADERAAKTAAGSFMSFGFATSYGLGDMEDGLLAVHAIRALDRWVEGVVSGYRAGQRVAA